MDGGLAIFGLGLFLLSIAGLYARTAFGLAWFLFALSLVSMGLAFSESKRLREVSLGMGILLLAAAIVGLIAGTVWWMVAGAFIFAAAYLVLWAEFRFMYFGNITSDQVPHHAHSRRWRIHWPRRTHRA
jgi:FtsH-binding integral membrane protein